MQNYLYPKKQDIIPAREPSARIRSLSKKRKKLNLNSKPIKKKSVRRTRGLSKKRGAKSPETKLTRKYKDRSRSRSRKLSNEKDNENKSKNSDKQPYQTTAKYRQKSEPKSKELNLIPDLQLEVSGSVKSSPPSESTKVESSLDQLDLIPEANLQDKLAMEEQKVDDGKQLLDKLSEEDQMESLSGLAIKRVWFESSRKDILFELSLGKEEDDKRLIISRRELALKDQRLLLMFYEKCLDYSKFSTESGFKLKKVPLL